MRRAALLVLAAVTIGTSAVADDLPRQRVVGLGSAAGGGFAAVTLTSATGASTNASSLLPAAMLPTLEGQIFLGRREWSIDVTVPLTNMIVVSGVVGGFFFQTDAFFNFNLGSGVARFIVGPGLGVSVVAAKSVNGAAFRVPAELGIELLLANKHIGIKLLARPYVEFAGGTAQAVGGGVIGLLGLSGYVTKT
jgi:hypothetical protein